MPKEPSTAAQRKRAARGSSSSSRAREKQAAPGRSENGVAWALPPLGRRLREIRTAAGLSLSALAAESDLSPSFISQVENGSSDISVGRLIRLAQALNVGLTDLVDVRPRRHTPVVRAEDRSVFPIRATGVKVWVLAPSLDNKRAYFLCELEEGAAIKQRARNLGSEYFVYVIRGAVEIDEDSGEVLTLREGDSASQRSDEFRRFANAHAGPSVALWVSTVLAGGE